MSSFPIIGRINQTLSEHDIFKKAHPSQQPDCPEDMRDKV